MKYYICGILFFILVQITHSQESSSDFRNNLSGLRATIDVQSTGFSLCYKWWLAERNALLVGLNVDDIYFPGLYNYISRADKPHIATTLNVFAQYEFHFKPIMIQKTVISPFVSIASYFGGGNGGFAIDDLGGIKGSVQGSIGLECFITSKFSIGVQQGLLLSYSNPRAQTIARWDLQSRCSILAHVYF
jgi:hypothetical protein